MNQSFDRILQVLTLKKRELIEKLLTLSQYFAIEQLESELDKILGERLVVFEQLQQNDLAILHREEEVGIFAKDQEEEVYKDIAFMIQSITENNQASIEGLEKEEERLNHEKAMLGRGNKVSGYIQQKRALQTFKPGQPSGFQQRVGWS